VEEEAKAEREHDGHVSPHRCVTLDRRPVSTLRESYALCGVCVCVCVSLIGAELSVRVKGPARVAKMLAATASEEILAGRRKRPQTQSTLLGEIFSEVDLPEDVWRGVRWDERVCEKICGTLTPTPAPTPTPTPTNSPSQASTSKRSSRSRTTWRRSTIGPSR
jgi:hypothetical protein